MSYTLIGPSKVCAGIGSLARLGEVLQGVKRLVLITDAGVGQTDAFYKVKQTLDALSIECMRAADAPTEPSLDQVRALCEACVAVNPDAVLAVGGGSVMDSAKLMAAAVNNPDMMKLLPESTGIQCRGVRTVMIPTTTGTGAEATGNAIVLLPEKQLKQGIVSTLLIPDVVVLDPEMVAGLSPMLTALTGMDALAHALECLVSKKATPFSDLFAMEALVRILPNIENCYRNGGDLIGREQMQLGAFYGGMSIALSGTLAVHALAYPLSGRLHYGHGKAIAVLLAPVMAQFEKVCESKYAEVAVRCGLCSADASRSGQAHALVMRLYALAEIFQVGKVSIPETDFADMARETLGIRRLMDNNPLELSFENIENIFRSIAL